MGDEWVRLKVSAQSEILSKIENETWRGMGIFIGQGSMKNEATRRFISTNQRMPRVILRAAMTVLPLIYGIDC